MQIILEEISLMKKIGRIGYPMERKKLRWSKHCIFIPRDGGVLLYQTMTGSVIWLSKTEYDSALRTTPLREKLTEGLFLVPEGFEERKHCDQLRTVVKQMEKKTNAITAFTIFTTTDCNARCYYCFEMGQKRQNMTAKTASDVAEYIIRVSKGSKISIRWFGGEPLFNEEAIDIITEKLRQHQVEYSSIMISNGYLFGEKQIKKAKDLWKLQRVQITLDGTETIYNRTKAYIYREGSAYQKVLGNIEKLAQAGVDVRVRLNMDGGNVDNIEELIHELNHRFKDCEHIVVYSVLLREYSGKIQNFSTEDAAIDAVRKIDQIISDYGVDIAIPIRRNVVINCCMADQDDAVTITPDGKLGKCEHFSDSMLIGSIYSEELKQAEIDAWKERQEPVSACEDCAVYPICYRLKRCNGIEKQCDSFEKNLFLYETEMKIINCYEKWVEEGEVK